MVVDFLHFKLACFALPIELLGSCGIAFARHWPTTLALTSDRVAAPLKLRKRSSVVKSVSLFITARYGPDRDAHPLSRFDVVRRASGEHNVISAGSNEGATLVRISIPSHFAELDTAIDQH